MKNPVVVISILFLASYILIGQFSNNTLSDEPVVLTTTPPQIIMFGSQSCEYCKLARHFFDKHQLPYTENDIDISDKHRQTFDILGGKGTPLIIINKELIHGFDEAMIRDAL